MENKTSSLYQSDKEIEQCDTECDSDIDTDVDTDTDKNSSVKNRSKLKFYKKKLNKLWESTMEMKKRNDEFRDKRKSHTVNTESVDKDKKQMLEPKSETDKKVNQKSLLEKTLLNKKLKNADQRKL